jgi:hypothetical protein
MSRQLSAPFGISRRRFRSIIETVEQRGSGSGASLGNPAIGRLGLGAHLGAELDKPGLRSL